MYRADWRHARGAVRAPKTASHSVCITEGRAVSRRRRGTAFLLVGDPVLAEHAVDVVLEPSEIGHVGDLGHFGHVGRVGALDHDGVVAGAVLLDPGIAGALLHMPGRLGGIAALGYAPDAVSVAYR